MALGILNHVSGSMRELDEATDRVRRLADIIEQSVSAGIQKSGSIAWRPIRQDPRGRYQVLFAWACPGHAEPMEMHVHDMSDEYFLVVSGRMVISDADGSIELLTGQCAKIPAGQPHSVSMDAGTEAVVTLIPPEAAYSVGDGGPDESCPAR